MKVENNYFLFLSFLYLFSLKCFLFIQIQLLIVYCSVLAKNDSITVSVWNQKKVHKKQGAGFMGCVKITSNLIQTLKDTGCK